MQISRTDLLFMQNKLYYMTCMFVVELRSGLSVLKTLRRARDTVVARSQDTSQQMDHRPGQRLGQRRSYPIHLKVRTWSVNQTAFLPYCFRISEAIDGH